ncbi:putative lipoprotein, partial [Vibrio parahaemolyticus EKP-028]
MLLQLLCTLGTVLLQLVA